MNLRLVGTDIDGTLVDSNGELSAVTLRVLRTLLDRGAARYLLRQQAAAEDTV